MMVVGARLKGFGPALEEAAATLGATPWQRFWRITVPLTAPGMVAAAPVDLGVAFDQVVISYFLALSDDGGRRAIERLWPGFGGGSRHTRGHTLAAFLAHYRAADGAGHGGGRPVRLCRLLRPVRHLLFPGP